MSEQVLVKDVVEVLHDRGIENSPRWTVGSGFLIGGKQVLTAAHNVGKGKLFVRVEGKREYTATIAQVGDADRGFDLAIVDITDSSFCDVPDSTVQFAGLIRHEAARLRRCWAIGFPRFKEKDLALSGRGQLRDTAQIDGEIPLGANLISGMLELHVTATPQASPHLGSSEWEGMSGAVVFTKDPVLGDCAIGVIVEHYQPEGVSSLTVVPITVISSLDEPTARGWWNLLGVSDSRELPLLPQLAKSELSNLDPEILDQIVENLVALLGLNKQTLQKSSGRPEPSEHVSQQINEVIDAQREVVAKGVSTTPQSLYNLGMLAAYKREYDTALGYFRQAVHADPEFTDAYEAIAGLQQSRATESLTLGRFDQAVNCLAEAHEAGIHTDPVNPQALALRGFIAKTRAQVAEEQHQLAERDRYYGEATRMFEQAAKLDPDNPSAQNGLGNVQYAQGNLDAAITAYNRVIELAPYYTAAHHDLALAYEGKMDADPENKAKWRHKALKAWQKTYELAPQDPAFTADYILIIGQHIQELKTLTG